MSDTLISAGVDRKVLAMESNFRRLLERSLLTFLDRAVPVTLTGPEPFEFKDVKALLPGEIVLATLTATESVQGKVLYAMTREDAAVLADLLLSGDGKAAFASEDHLEPLRDLFREITASLSSDIGKEIGKHVAFDDMRIVLIDLSPSDFAGSAWVVNKLECEIDRPLTILRIVAKEFIRACYPEESSAPEGRDSVDLSETDESIRKEMGLVLDIELDLSIELGRTSMLIRDIVKLGPGSIVELDKLSGEPVDLYVNGRRFAKGEVVVVDENFAVRITELVPVEERMKASRN
ncbi:flagellar motor switch protein FliN [candidate division KSB1 bacterium]|nr:flagellar motor switch protein FliN [candidate division KSB1 bacterium]